MRLRGMGKTEPIMDLCKTLSEETAEYRKMDAYSTLLKQSIGSILKTEEEKEVKSLFQAGGTTALTDRIKGEYEDFKLISFLIVR